MVDESQAVLNRIPQHLLVDDCRVTVDVNALCAQCSSERRPDVDVNRRSVRLQREDGQCKSMLDLTAVEAAEKTRQIVLQLI